MFNRKKSERVFGRDIQNRPSENIHYQKYNKENLDEKNKLFLLVKNKDKDKENIEIKNKLLLLAKNKDKDKENIEVKNKLLLLAKNKDKENLILNNYEKGMGVEFPRKISKDLKLFLENDITKAIKYKEEKNNNNRKNKNLQEVDDYCNEIIPFLIKSEKINIYDYSSNKLFDLQDSGYINENKRGVILQWLITNNNNWNLNDDTIFMAMNILDRYTSKVKISNNDYQLVAISSYLIASKYEDIYPPLVEELSEMASFRYSSKDITSMEYNILSTLNFDVLYTSSYKYLSLFYTISGCNKNLFYLAQFILELSLQNLEILGFSQVYRAIACLLIAKKILKIKKSDLIIKYYYNYKEEIMKRLQKNIVIFLLNTIKSAKKNFIIEKFDSTKYDSVFDIIKKKFKADQGKASDENKRKSVFWK